MRLPSDATLIVIDAEPPGGEALGPPTTALACLGHLVAVWRGEGLAVVHARGADGDAGAQTTPCVDGVTVIARPAASAFVGTGLDEHLTERGCTTLVVCGFDTDLAVEASVRHAADLGFRLFVVADACAAPDRTDLAGRAWTGTDVHRLALARMAAVDAKIVDLRTAWIAAKTAGWGRK